MLIMRNYYVKLLISPSQWLSVVLFLVLTRLFLNIPAIIGANWFSLKAGALGSIELNPNSVPGVWARWDTGYYLRIATDGYSFRGEELAFFPAYPFVIWLFSGGGLFSVTWVGFLIANLAFILASTLLWCRVKEDFNQSIAWGTIIALNLFPTSFFFSAIYTESLFLLFSVLVYWFSARRQYLLAGLFVSLASLTRINGVLLVFIPLVEILITKPKQFWLHFLGIGSVSGMGLGLYGVYLWFTQGHPLTFILAQRQFEREIVWPWQTILDSFAVAAYGYGGFHWYMRMISLINLSTALLFLGCTILTFFLVRRDLFAYSAATMCLYLISHGPGTLGLMALSRYVLILFPCFIVIAILLERIPKLKWSIWAASSIMLLLITISFTNGRWVA